MALFFLSFQKGQRSAKGTSPGEKQRAQRSSSSSEELTDEDESFVCLTL